MKRLQFILILIFAMVARATTGPVAGGYHIDNGDSLVINEHGTEKIVTNNHASGLTIYIPTTSSAEWSSYVAGPPAGVTVEDPSVGGNYFVMTSTTMPNGNLGGLAGANATCLSDLQANNWLGKENVTLNSSTVKAWLCDGSTCNNTLPNTTYSFARSGSATAGGATFTTDGSGVGPGNTTAWHSSTYFGISAFVATGRATGTSTAWGMTSHANTCNGWTSSSGAVTGRDGDIYSGGTGTTRWSDTNNECDFSVDSDRLICLVDDPGSGSSDPDFANVVLLIQPDASSSTIDDLSNSVHSPSAVNGAALSTAVSDPWGGTRKVIAFDGNDDYLSVADSADWTMGSGDFTWEAWIYFNTLGSSEFGFIFGQINGSSTAYHYLALANDWDSGLSYEHGDVSPNIGGYESDKRTTPVTSWIHVAVVRAGTQINLYVNGSLSWQIPIVSGSLADFSTPLNIGGIAGSPSDSVNGYMTGIRFTKGVARYTSGFTPPTEPFPEN